METDETPVAPAVVTTDAHADLSSDKKDVEKPVEEKAPEKTTEVKDAKIKETAAVTDDKPAKSKKS